MIIDVFLFCTDCTSSKPSHGCWTHPSLLLRGCGRQQEQSPVNKGFDLINNSLLLNYGPVNQSV